MSVATPSAGDMIGDATDVAPTEVVLLGESLLIASVIIIIVVVDAFPRALLPYEEWTGVVIPQ